jgi:hypothetical protein
MIMTEPQLRLDLCSIAWPESLSQALQTQGFASATAYAESRPQASLAELAVELGGPGTEPMILEQRLIEEAEAAGTMERCARSLLARDLRVELPDGWQRGGTESDDEARSQSFRLGGVFLTLAMALPETYQDAIGRVQQAVNTSDILAGWRPVGPDDPVLVLLFACSWNAPST